VCVHSFSYVAFKNLQGVLLFNDDDYLIIVDTMGGGAEMHDNDNGYSVQKKMCYNRRRQQNIKIKSIKMSITTH
jgi:hypothetical protein